MSELAVKGTERASDTQLVAREFAQRLKYMVVNGSKLNDQDVYALAQYASATGLDPFAGECWIIPGKGVCPGIAGWRKKAQEQLEYEARESNETNGSHFWLEFKDATTDDCVFDPTKGDIAYVAVLRDSISQHRWRTSVIDTTNDFMKMGVKFGDALAEAKALVGPEPVWISSGVVFNTESFGGLEKFDRKERAKKRAEKLALRKRFPRIHLPEPEGIDDVADISDYSIDVQEVTHSADENIKVLGYGEPVEPELARAMAITGSDGVAYGDCTDKELEGKKIGIIKSLEKGDLDNKKQSQYQEKLDAIALILNSRK